jgi:hypothetical protein
LSVGVVLQAGWFRSSQAVAVIFIAVERIDDAIAAGGGISITITSVAVELAGPAETCVGDDGEEGAPVEWWGGEESKRLLCRGHLQMRETVNGAKP